jgi:4-hydroxy-3-methylbut-2-en-1-yl diphosphate reductase
VNPLQNVSEPGISEPDISEPGISEVVLVEPRGFCAGVEMAIKALAWMVRSFPAPVYCYHEIVHNRIVVDRFIDAGVIFVNDISEVPPGAPLMLSAHGSSPEVVAAAKANGGFVVDAVCPLVTKVHHEAKVRAGKGFQIIYIGHEGHDEAMGTMAVAPSSMHLVETVDQINNLELEGPVALLAQTTLSHFDWADLQAAAQAKFPEMWVPGHSDLCYATTNRQSALKTVSGEADVVIVVGSQNSSNTVALAKVATATGAARVLRINTADEVPGDINGRVIVTSGASAPDELVQSIVARLIELGSTAPAVTVTRVITEDEYFPLPRGLRDFVNSVASVWAYALGAPIPASSPTADDRNTSASVILEHLGV